VTLASGNQFLYRTYIAVKNFRLAVICCILIVDSTLASRFLEFIKAFCVSLLFKVSISPYLLQFSHFTIGLVFLHQTNEIPVFSLPKVFI
jgi:hypothetical protein